MRTLLSWSSGKDSAWTLYTLQKTPGIKIEGLFTTTNSRYDRAAMHSTRTQLITRQAEAAGLPLRIIELPDPCTNEQYQVIMRGFISECISSKIERIAFGDLFLEDIRNYRIEQLKGTGIDPMFPIWLVKPCSTKLLAKQMLDAGLETYISCIDLKKLPRSFAGRRWDRTLIEELPDGCDPCGENGEFHTIVTGGPMFNKSIPVKTGEIVEREGFAFADIIPV